MAARHQRYFPIALGLLLGGWLLPAGRAVAQPTATHTTLTNAAQVRALAPEIAARQLPVRLAGVVVADAGGGGSSLVLQDASEAIYLIGPANLVSPIRPGDRIEIRGVTDPGDFAPIVHVQGLKKTGTGPLPEPRRVTYEDLMRKHFDAQFVEIAGVVRSCEPVTDSAYPRSRMILATGSGQLAVRLHAALPKDSYVDAEVRLRGICYSRHTAGRQFLSPLLDVPRNFAVIVDRPAPENSFQTPVVPVADLLKFAPDRDYGHRVHVRGTVTHYNPGGSLWLREGDHGLQIRSAQITTNLHPGDVVEALGFPNRGNYSPILEDGNFILCGTNTIPAPILVTNLAAVVAQDSDLVQLEGQLEDIRPVQNGWMLILDWGKSRIEAVLELPKDTSLPKEWLIGSRVRIAGIASVIADPTGPLSGVWQPKSFSLLVRSPDDLTVLQPPPWWNHERLLTLMIALVCASLAVTATAMLVVRLRLREQSRRRAMAEAEFAAILSERNRLAREIHDTLAQGLTATSVQLRLAKKDSASGSARLAERLDEALSLVRASLDEARKSIWNMRSQVLETGDLATALDGILKQLTKDTGIGAGFEVAGKIRRLSPAIENNLLRAGQEAIANAVKHARAKTISVRLEFAEKSLALTVRDNGGGFDPAHPPPSAGGFGLVGMRERAELVHGELTVRSSPDTGTEIVLRVPLAAE